MTYELDDNEVLDSGLNVSLQKNTLMSDGSLYARVANRTASVKGVLTSIKDDGASEKDVSLMRHYLKIYEAKLLQLLQMGYAVKVMDLGVLRIKHKGSIKTASEGESLSNFTVAFTPSSKAIEAVQGLASDTATVLDNSPSLEAVTDLYRNAEDGAVTAGEPVKVTGRHLKLGQESDTLYFVPQTSLNTDVEDTSEWIAVERDMIFRNMPSELNFFAPSSLDSATSYRIRISTTYLSSGNSRKEALTGESDVITVA